MHTSRRSWLAGALGAGAASAFAGTQTPPAAHGPSHPIGDEGVGPGEDLMREHGVLNRILLIYDEGIRRTQVRGPLPLEALRSAAGIIRRFLEEYHEKLEEEHLFPPLRARREARRAGLRPARPAPGGAPAHRLDPRARLAPRRRRRTRRPSPTGWASSSACTGPTTAREDTVLFPAFRELVSREEYERLGRAVREPGGRGPRPPGVREDRGRGRRHRARARHLRSRVLHPERVIPESRAAGLTPGRLGA